MVRVTDELVLSPEHVALYHATDPLLGHQPVLIFHGSSTTANYTHNSSRVQVHVVTPAGHQSFPRLTISPNSSSYKVVNHLPREFQGDEVYRGLAFGLIKYFGELSEGVKNDLRNRYPTRGKRPGSGPELFSEQHAADVVKSMALSPNTSDVIAVLQEALQTQHISNIDLDFVLPPGAVVPLQHADLEEVPDDEDDILDPTLRQYGGYTPLVKLFGEPVFLPTSKLRRAPSRPTTLNRRKSFSKDQKADLRMKLVELVETEERYVQKLGDLVSHVADDFRQSAKQRKPGSLSPSEEELEKLFPSSSTQILQVNSAFFEELRRIMEETEEDATRDMEITTAHMLGSKVGSPTKPKDPSGALAMARLFLEWFPKFTQCYQDYIKASQHFPTLLNSFLDQQSSFRQRVNQTGEQAIRSILIEPVQRLPRYSLLIDQIVSCLPMTHTALQPMLKARDIISNICSMDDPLPDKPHVANRLRNMVQSWPLDLEPKGRLVLAADLVEILPPFQGSVNQADETSVFLLFSDCVIILKKTGGTMTGRDLIREVDKPSAAGLLISMTNAAGGPGKYEFVFTGWHNLCDIRFTESSDGTLVWMTSTQELKAPHPGEFKVSKAVTSRCFHFIDSFAGKAAKFGEDVVKARVEARFSEVEREDPCWTLRSTRMPDSNLGLHAAVFQEGADQLIDGRREPAPIRVVVDHEKGTKGAPVGHYGVEIVVNVTIAGPNKVRMVTAGLNGKEFQDEVAIDDFLPTMSRRVIHLMSTQFCVSNKTLTSALVSYYSKATRGLPLATTRAERTRSFLSSSPVKMLSSIWGSGNKTPEESPFLPKHAKANSLSRNNSQVSFFGSLRGKAGTDAIATEEIRAENPLMRLEETFLSYMAALQSRKGAIIGRSILNRSMVDELSVNDLYNRLIESPQEIEASDQHPSEVIFAAFEKFLRVAWFEHLGLVISIHHLDTLQERANKNVPGSFADFVNFLFGDMAPQNRRAFTSLIKLLADLLDGCGNDSDRGALTLAFAELVVADGSAPNYINLLDRLVVDCDRIFEEPGLNHSFGLNDQAYDSINSAIRGKSYAPSVNSQTSSIRRKFGFDLLSRQNSKDERPSVWRQLSKHRNNDKGVGETSSFSRATGKIRSIDDDFFTKKGLGILRPGSRERPQVVGAYDDQRPDSAHRMDFPLNTIGEPKHESRPKTPKSRQRRSSLSDLRSLMTAASIEDNGSPLQPLELTKQTSEKFNSAQRSPPPSRLPMSPHATIAIRSPRQKENLTEIFQRPESPAKTDSRAESPTKSDISTRHNSPFKRRPHAKTMSTSHIPTLKPSSRPTTAQDESSRPGSGHSPSRSGNSKLRLQSPQKLRERLQTEKDCVEDIDAVIKSELSKIGEEMARVTSASLAGDTGVDLDSLAMTMQVLEERMGADMRILEEQQLSLQRDMDTSVKASESKVKAIDQLYKEAVAENELLYEKFHTELGKIIKALKGKAKEDKEELISKLKEQGEETARTKKENARLKREMVSLRAALKATE